MKNGFSASFRYRFMDDRPANKLNTVKAKGHFMADLNFSYAWKKFELVIPMENLFNQHWREAQFKTESRLRFEPQPVSEINYTPGTPRFLTAGISLEF